ncbi:hypothetical protein ACOSP6_13895 [Tenacibaculum sp. MEBiC06402]|uniref:hypothetical protein n=1 Tax=unclassified Tenacibaculum TaxID=2635139 RepID=UPI003B995189
MKELNLEKMTNKELQDNENMYKKRLIFMALATVVLLVIGNVPSILGEYYPSNTFFKMSFVVFFIYFFRIFPKWKAVKSEIKKRNTQKT